MAASSRGREGETKRKKLLGASLCAETNCRAVSSSSAQHIDAWFLRRSRILDSVCAGIGVFLRLSEWVLHRERLPDTTRRPRSPRKLAPFIGANGSPSWFGSCIAVTGILTRMLDRLGVGYRDARLRCVKDGRRSARHSQSPTRRGSWLCDGTLLDDRSPFDIVDLTPSSALARRDEAFQRRTEGRACSGNEIRQSPRRRCYCTRAASIGNGRGMHRALFDRSALVRCSRLARLAWIVWSSVCRFGIDGSRRPLRAVNLEARAGRPRDSIWNEDVVQLLGFADGAALSEIFLSFTLFSIRQQLRGHARRC